MQGLPQASSLTELLTGSFISAVNAIPYVVWIARADGHIEYLNTTWREITGYTHNNPAQESWLDCLHADQRHTFMPSWQDAVHSGEPWTMEFKLWSSADKDYRWQKAHAKAFPDSGGWIGSCHDIHDQKLAEQLLKTSETRLRSVIEESPVGVVLLDRTGQPVYYNRKCAELRGLEVNQVAWLEALHPEDRDRVVNSWAKAAEKAIPWNEIYRFLHRDGEVVWVSGRAVPIRDGTDLLGFVRTIEDVTEFKRTEEQLRQAHQQLAMHAGQLEREVQQRTCKIQEALFELDKLSYSIVHDMRAPLRTISGFAHLLLEAPSNRFDQRSTELLKLIADAARRQDRLIQDVLTYHNYVRENFPLSPIDLDRVVAHILETYANLQPSKIDITVRSPLGWVMAHETLLTQCISALLNNAAKFVAPGTKPQIRVWSENIDTQIKFWVRDNGIGISPESVPKLFDIFYKFHRPDEYPGSGIGLPLAKKALERMQGAIGVESEVGKGASFWIALRKAPVP